MPEFDLDIFEAFYVLTGEYLVFRKSLQQLV